MKTKVENEIEKFVKANLPKAGEILRKKFKKVGVKYTKSHALDVVTEADLAANRLLLSAIKKTFPDHGIISEETAEYKNGSEYIWVIDPLDGTLNFSRGIPIFVTMLAVFRNKELIMSAIYDPLRKEMTFARKGLGATVDGKKIMASKNNRLSESIGGVSSVFKKEQKKLFDMLVDSEKRVVAITIGSAGANGMYVARGAIDWYVNYNPRIWDIAPNVLLFSEAGYKVTNIAGKPWKFGDQGIIAAEKTLHKRLVELVKKSMK
ncbi:MAG: hypothetical protein A3J76_03005 [Candidatus Moranbacteria bacterium RBG_13_45_13]|nr:MAG: hypothetical protein A3J76_03005 [Candidatus Moranbacteria bacterium RBG_13_45_13]